MARVLAVRVVFNARDAGLALEPTTASISDIKMMRIPLASLDKQVALENMATAPGVVMPQLNGNPAKISMQPSTHYSRANALSQEDRN